MSGSLTDHEDLVRRLREKADRYRAVAEWYGDCGLDEMKSDIAAPTERDWAAYTFEDQAGREANLALDLRAAADAIDRLRKERDEARKTVLYWVDVHNDLTKQHQQAEQRAARLAGLRPAVVDFAEEMERKLRLHDKRPGWEGESMDWLLGRLRQEVGELAAAIAVRSNGIDITNEAADVANFAMMIADNVLLRHARAALSEGEGGGQ